MEEEEAARERELRLAVIDEDDVRRLLQEEGDYLGRQ
jgi:hypothetical protein